MEAYAHQLLDAVIPRPLFFILARFSNLMYRLFFGLYNDPTSWRSTLLPPLIALIAGYFALLAAYRTLQSTVRLVWWSVKWGAILGSLLYVYAWWTGEAEAAHSTGQAPGFFGALAGGAARDAPTAPAALTGLAAWLPLLAALQRPQEPRQPYANRRRAARADGGIAEAARSLGLDITDDDIERGTGFLQSLLHSVGLGSAVDAQPGPAAGRRRQNAQRAPRRAPTSNTAGNARRRQADGIFANFPGFDLGLPPDDEEPIMDDALPSDDDEDDFIYDDGPATRTRSRTGAAARARRRRQNEARRARSARTGRGGAADVQRTRDELVDFFRDLFA